MGTRSRIGVMHGDKCKSVYCHWDGYIAHNGEILEKFYDSTKANQLVALGDLSSLRKNIGEKHAFSSLDISEEEREQYELDHGDSCTFYGRDRGETETEWKVAQTFDEFLEQCDNCGADYYYVMEDGEWFVGSTYGEFKGRLVRLSQVLEKELAEQFN
jgi:hypothetical protein